VFEVTKEFQFRLLVFRTFPHNVFVIVFFLDFIQYYVVQFCLFYTFTDSGGDILRTRFSLLLHYGLWQWDLLPISIVDVRHLARKLFFPSRIKSFWLNAKDYRYNKFNKLIYYVKYMNMF